MKRATTLVVILFAISGIAGLIYELVWIRMLSHLLGGTSIAISTVLACFMGGLGLGSYLLGRVADRTEHPLRLYAGLELGIAVTGAAVPLLIHWLGPLYVSIAHTVPGPALACVRILLAAAVMILPTILMGGTLPVLSRFLVRHHERLGRGIGLLYAVNTMGAVLGAFLTGFVLIPTLGVLTSTIVAVAGNALAAIVAYLIGRQVSVPVAIADPEPVESSQPAAGKPATETTTLFVELDGRLLALLFAATGFAAFGFELYWTRALGHFLGNSTYAFSAMLTTYLFGLAAGGWLGGRLADRVSSPATLWGWLQIALAATVMLTVPMIWAWLPALAKTPFLNEPILPWHTYLWRRFALAFAVMLVPSMLAGMSFPLVNRIGIPSLARLGRGVGRLYFANTTGSILGSLAAGFVILPLVGAKTALLVTALLSGIVGVTIHAAHRRRSGDRIVPAVLLVAVFGLLSWPLATRTSRPLSDTQGPEDTVLFQKEDATAETRVYRKPNGEMHMSVDGHLIGGTSLSINRKEKILAHLPLALVPAAEQVLAVGLGSGITLGSISLYPEIQKLTCLEIVPGVVEGARQFRHFNHDVMDDPRLEMIVGDGIQYLLTTQQEFDVISSDSKLNPEYSGNSVLLSQDYYELCRERLSERGVMVQWLGINLPHSELRVILRSFLQVFEHVELFWNDSHNLVVAGSRSPIAFDIDRSRMLRQTEEVATDLEGLLLDDPYIMPSCRVAGQRQLRAELGDGRLNTWLRPTVEFRIVPAYRDKTRDNHEDDNFRWLAEMWTTDDFQLTGEVDQEYYNRYCYSSRKFLQAISAVEKSRHQQTGEEHLRDGLEHNPDDARLASILGYFEQARDRLTSYQKSESLPPEAPSGAGAAKPEDEQSESTTATDMLYEAMRLLDAGQAEEALASLDHLLELVPDDASVRFQRIRALRQLGRLQEATDEATGYVESNPQQVEGYSLLGLCFLDAEDFPAAGEAFLRSTELDANNYRAWSNLASALVKQGRFEEAGHAFAEVHRLQPAIQGVAYSAAACFSQAGMTVEAARWVDVCLESGKVDPRKFLDSNHFEKLRASENWDAQRIEAAARNWR